MVRRVRFQETLRRLAMIDEGFVTSEAGLGLDPAATSALDVKTAALLQVGACVAIGSPPMCLEWSTGRALAARHQTDVRMLDVPGYHAQNNSFGVACRRSPGEGRETEAHARPGVPGAAVIGSASVDPAE